MNSAGATTAGTTAAATFHLHPLRRCNLACRHCYSHSSPYESDLLSREEALAAIRQASAWGYSRLAVSGGEPLLYPWLEDCVALAAGLGMETAVITNGLLVARPQCLQVLRKVDVVGVSIDGLSDSHNTMRGGPRAFAHVMEGLGVLADAGIGFGIVCGVCTNNLDEIDAVAETVHRAGARSLQFHPIAAAGRAAELMRNDTLSSCESNLLYVAAAMLNEQYAGRMLIHTDLMHRRLLIDYPELAYGGEMPADYLKALPASLLGVLVMEPDGTLNPVGFGFPPHLSLGNARKAPFDVLWQDWLRQGYPRLLELGRTLVRAARLGNLPEVLNPNDALFLMSQPAEAPLVRTVRMAPRPPMRREPATQQEQEQERAQEQEQGYPA